MPPSTPPIRILVLTLLILSGCGQKQTETDLVTFDLKGVVVSINYAKHRIIIDHEEIPDYMMAMTMPFKVKDTTLLSNVEPGDSIRGVLAVSRTESWLEAISVIGRGEETVNAASAADEIFRRMYKVGDHLPDFSFINQEARKIRLSDFRGKAIAITFIYSRCPLPDFCIRMSDNFARLQKSLSRDPLLKNKWHLLTVSFDPEFDKPPVLKRYGTAYGADFSTWDFVTDTTKTLQEFADGLELIMEDDEGGLIAHNLRTAVIDPGGTLAAVFKGNEWTVKELEGQVRNSINR